ncbi:uncharacterized protein LOC117105364 [Anneissia japonica]|uniref:uncharacterized protein LOC117105364 n=1 Tax=Anneissia japonica TaxID=1529436 RepID=UPI0014259350|nr:uncharacterized protein LOC117105364 [Anneissia japonica]XP_033102385.1 uncharacterized protein LOC117105364 [Anneissia japonica]
MNEHVSSYLRGFYSYERSFNRRVLADDKEIEAAYEQARLRGKLPFNRSKILILGDHGVGKTSTSRRLQGKSFRHDEPSTMGIKTNTVKAKVSDVNGKWSEISNTPLEDFECSAAWWAVSHVSKHGVTETSRPVSKSEVKPNTSLINLKKDLFGQITHTIPVLVLFLNGGFMFGFGLVAWMCIISLMFITDVHTAYRFGCGYTIVMTFVDSAIELGLWIHIPNFTIALHIIFALIAGVLLGTGGRTGLCLAFCIMVHPKQKTFSIDNVTEMILVIYSKAYYKLIIYIVSIITILTFRYVAVKIFSMSRRNCISVLISIFVSLTAAGFIGGPDFLSLFYTCTCIFVLLSVLLVGILLGRKFVAYGYIPQMYIIKKCIGFGAGIFMAYFFGWELTDLTPKLQDTQYYFPQYLLSLLLFLAPIIAFFVYEWFSYVKVKTTTSIPIKHIRKSMEAGIRNEPYLDARLSIWDFAGQNIYYNTHHLFMPKQGVYLIVFNAVKAVMNPGKQIKRLQFWLQSVAMHGDIKNVVVFLVGTSRESVDNNALLQFTQLTKAHLYKPFSRLLAFHPLGSFLFFIENSLQVDQERSVLQTVIHNEIKKLDFFQENHSVKYLLFHEILNRFRLQKYIMMSLVELFEEVKLTCNIISENELCKFLNFFDRSGDVIYNERDETLRHYVICDPQMIIDILTILVNVPEPQLRNRTVADLFQRLKDTGIVDSRLLEHICRQKKIWRHYPYIIRFLVGTNLLFPLNAIDPVDQVGTFILPCRLPKFSLMSKQNSNVHSKDTFYFDFGEILHEFIFLRLIAKCCEVFSWDTIYYNVATFRTVKSCLFFISTEVISGNINSYDRNLIKVEVISEEITQTMFILQKIVIFIEEIINRDFNLDYFRKHYICGPVCERCSSLDYTMCLVNLITHGNDISTLDGYKPDIYHTVTLELKLKVTCNRKIDSQ